MARAKATTTDIYAKLAKGECANFHSGRCQGGSPCAVIEGGACEYFSTYVKPLLEYPEFSGKYGREAKIFVALNPKSKIARKRQAGKETLTAFDAESSPKNPLKAKSAPKSAKKATTAPSSVPPPTLTHTPRNEEIAVANIVTESGKTHVKPTVINTRRDIVPKEALPVPQLELLLELTPDTPYKTGKRR